MQVVHNRYTTHIKDSRDDNIVFVILSAGVGNRMRSYGPKCLFKTSEETILDKHLHKHIKAYIKPIHTYINTYIKPFNSR